MASESLAPPRPAGVVAPAPAAGFERRFPELDLSACPALLVVAARPDDELLGLGGTMAALVDRGVDVQVVAVRDRDASATPTGSPALDRQLPEHRFDQRVGAGILGVTEPINLGLPAANLDRYAGQLADRLTEVLAELPSGSWCAAPWGADSAVVADAAALAARRTGAHPLQYPVWYRHWPAAGGPTLPWDRVHTVTPPAAALGRKHDAAQWFIGSFRPDARAAVASVLWPALTASETVFV